MNKLDNTYLDLVKDIIDNGTISNDRTGTGTKKIFGKQFRHNMQDGFPLLTSKKLYTKGIIHELLWFLRGDTNIKYLIDNDVNIWNGDAYKNFINKNKNLNLDLEINKNIVVVEGPIYNATPRLLTQEEFINKIKIDDKFSNAWCQLGPIYGKQWRGYCTLVPVSYHKGLPTEFKPERKLDQIQQVIDDLKNNPDSRRIMVNAWNVSEIDEMILPPCHYGFQLFTRKLSDDERRQYVIDNFIGEENEWVMRMNDLDWNLIENQFGKIPERSISLMWNQRSVDTGLGLPFNIASYGLLLEMFAHVSNMIPDELIGNLGDTHLYLDQIEPIQEQFNREQFELPRLSLNKGITNIFDFKFEDIEIINYKSSPSLKLPLSN